MSLSDREEIKEMVNEIMYSHGFTALEMTYVANNLKDYSQDAQTYGFKLAIELIDKHGIDKEMEEYYWGY